MYQGFASLLEWTQAGDRRCLECLWRCGQGDVPSVSYRHYYYHLRVVVVVDTILAYPHSINRLVCACISDFRFLPGLLSPVAIAAYPHPNFRILSPRVSHDVFLPLLRAYLAIRCSRSVGYPTFLSSCPFIHSRVPFGPFSFQLVSNSTPSPYISTLLRVGSLRGLFLCITKFQVVARLARVTSVRTLTKSVLFVLN